MGVHPPLKKIDLQPQDLNLEDALIDTVLYLFNRVCYLSCIHVEVQSNQYFAVSDWSVSTLTLMFCLGGPLSQLNTALPA